MRQYLFLVFFLMITASFAQRKPANLLERKGDEQFFYFEYLKSAKTYQEALESDTANSILMVKVAESFRMAHQPEKAKAWYEKAFRSDTPPRDQPYKINFARVLIGLGFVDEATRLLRGYQEDHGADAQVTTLLSGLTNRQALTKSQSLYAVKGVDFNSARMDFSPFPYQNGLVFVSSRPKKGSARPDEEGALNLFYSEESAHGTFSDPEPLEPGKVSSYHEGPVVFLENDTRKIFTRNKFVRKGHTTEEAVSTLELAWSERSPSGKWSEPVALSFAGAEFSVAHPAISSDGTTLYFSSNMPGTLGGSDLFVSRFEDGAWSSPLPMGPEVNTPGQDLFPFLHKDSLLFFASNGHSGLGGLDLFYCDLKTTDLTVVNLGAPINSTADDFGISLEAGGWAGFFSSNRKGGKGADDIYYFEEKQPFAEIEVLDSITLSGIATATLALHTHGSPPRKTSTSLSGKAELRISPLRDYQLSVAADGYRPYEIELDPGTWPQDQKARIRIYLSPVYTPLEIRTNAAQQLRRQESLTNVITFSSSPLDVDLPTVVKEIEVPEGPDSARFPVVRAIAVEVVNDLPALMLVQDNVIHQFNESDDGVLSNKALDLEITIPRGAQRHDYENIISRQLGAQEYQVRSFMLIRSFFFDSGKTWVRNDAGAQLDKIIEVMHAFPGVEVEMTFHADSRGSNEFNLDLSKTRSEEVKQYLIRSGIPAEKIHSRFVGESQLLNDCGDLADCNELLHQINRTTEVKLILNKL